MDIKEIRSEYNKLYVASNNAHTSLKMFLHTGCCNENIIIKPKKENSMEISIAGNCLLLDREIEIYDDEAIALRDMLIKLFPIYKK